MENDVYDDVRQLLGRTLDAHLEGIKFRTQLMRVFIEWLDADTAATPLGMLPALTCESAGGDRSRTIPLIAVWQLLRLTAKTLDDVQDEIGRRSVETHLNVAIGLFVAAQAVLDQVSEPAWDGLTRRIRRHLNGVMLRAAEGQHRDLLFSTGLEKVDPETWRDVALAKSGEPFGWATWSGALLAGADDDTAAGYRSYGRHLGILLQVADDFSDVWGRADTDDLLLGQLSLPVCYALFVTERATEHDTLFGLLERAAAGSRSAATEARAFLTDVGAQSYLLLTARVQQQKALEVLRAVAADTPARRRLEALPEQLFPALQVLNRSQQRQ